MQNIGLVSVQKQEQRDVKDKISITYEHNSFDGVFKNRTSVDRLRCCSDLIERDRLIQGNERRNTAFRK